MFCTNCKTVHRNGTGIDVSKMFNCPEGIGHVCSIKCKKELIANLKDGSHWIGVGKEYENSID
jgi:hypothetical protein|tara:strand:+ start:3857 stop:4045 length:189 start_codon:yes stop_codon:yes gene_type:complete